MDRQTLLEQKRQRLQELKQRRTTSGSGILSQDDSVNQLIEKLSNSSKTVKMVSVAVQVNFPGTSGENTQQFVKKIDPGKEAITYDKAIQATVDYFEPNKKSPEPEPEKESVQKEVEVKKAEFTNTYALNAAIKESIRLINKVSVDTSNITDYSKNIEFESQFKSGATKHPFRKGSFARDIDRPVQCIDLSPHFPELFLVAFAPKLTSKGRTTPGKDSSPGLAVIYSSKDDVLFPEYFLHCAAPITTIHFDTSILHKVIAGLADGKVVIWDLQQRNESSSDVAILPSLQTPLFSSLSLIALDPNFQFRSHSLAITEIIQLSIDGNDSIVSFSLDGVVNTWSTNLLATPKLETIQLLMPKKNNEFSNLRDSVRISAAMLISNSYGDDDASTGSDHKFLNGVVVASENGKLFRLSNNTREEHISQTYQELISQCDNITDTAEMNSYILTSHLDWTLRIWSLTQSEPVVTIPTRTPIMRISQRPGTPTQFVTLGLMNKTGFTVVQFWDLQHSLFKAVLEINVETVVTGVAFCSNSNAIYIGHEDGTISKWNINEEVLKSVTEGTNDGLQSYLKSQVSS